MSCGAGHRHGSDPTLLWLWHRPEATALIRPLSWEPPYAMGAAQEMAKSQKKKILLFLFHVILMKYQNLLLILFQMITQNK